MDVESRKMVWMFFFAKQKQRHRRREQKYGYQSGRWWGGGMDWEIGIHIHILLCVNTQLMRTYWVAQGILPSA